MKSEYKSWGKSVSIDLFGCDLKKICSPIWIKKYIREVIKVIDMKAHGPIYIDRFGLGELEGYSAMQFIETSSITVHCDETDSRVFIDIFSCKDFSPKKSADFSRIFFDASKVRFNFLTR